MKGTYQFIEGDPTRYSFYSVIAGYTKSGINLFCDDVLSEEEIERIVEEIKKEKVISKTVFVHVDRSEDNVEIS